MSENTKPRKRLIIKLNYPPSSRKCGSDSYDRDENKRRKIQDSVKPIVTCYWVDLDYRTKSTTLSQPKDNNVVENKKVIKNQVSKVVMSQPKDNNIVTENKKILKNQVSKTEIAFNGPKESSRLCSKSILMVKDSSKTTFVARAEECGLKKPMECDNRRQCWLILKRMLVDRGGWDLKDPPKIAIFDKSKIKAICLRK
ncbi:uncharacterized protein LOC127094744 [Lathyrus oleraceus]|uniref:uncharacterized protein LOC127094744 n=1 Tax=Pisum sativum TaxID=3888 RepID=UPI0021CEE770|nr:uncharacterized protein LOC127094744 [Pisum sativum]